MNRTITTLFCLLLISLPASAQKRDLKPGINYTTLAKPKTAKPAEALPTEETSAKINEEKEQDPATVVWNKYKELATGQTSEQKEAERPNKGPKKPKTPKKPSVNKPTAKSPDHASDSEKQQNAFSNLLNEWKSTKDSKKEMRSKSFKVPNQPSNPQKDPS